MTLRDPSEILRQGIRDWWTAQGTLASLGTPAMADDDGSPASQVSSNPHVSILFGQADKDAVSNLSTFWLIDFVFQVFDSSPQQSAAAVQPLDDLLFAMLRDDSLLPTMSVGYINELRFVRSRATQIAPLLWRADRELVARLVIPG